MIALVGSTLGYAVSGPFFLMGRIYRPLHSVAGRLLRFAIATLMRIEPWFHARVTITPVPGCLTVSNHRSHLDAFILLSQIPNVRMICKQSLFRVPGLAMMMRAMRQIPIRRGDTASYQAAMETAREALRAGDSVHVFPEMMRCEPGTKGTNRFHLAPFQVAYQEKRSVVPIVFRGTDDVWPKGKLGLRFRRPVAAEMLEPVDPAAYSCAAALAVEVKRRIEARLAEQI